jgi:hypothetical protein
MWEFHKSKLYLCHKQVVNRVISQPNDIFLGRISNSDRPLNLYIVCPRPSPTGRPLSGPISVIFDHFSLRFRADVTNLPRRKTNQIYGLLEHSQLASGQLLRDALGAQVADFVAVETVTCKSE